MPAETQSCPSRTPTQPCPRKDGDGQSIMRCEQAIFTSKRTATACGYRIVAASAGLKAAEKRVISARSPSHGGLIHDGADACGLSFYHLPAERSSLPGRVMASSRACG